MISYTLDYEIYTIKINLTDNINTFKFITLYIIVRQDTKSYTLTLLLASSILEVGWKLL